MKATVKMVLPLPAGSAPDVRHRLIAQALSQLWGHQVIVESRPGGGGLIGTRAALAEEPDGYTILVGLASVYMILPAQNEKLPFDVNEDMVPIGLTALEGLVFACSPRLGVSTLPEFIELAKKNPPVEISMASVKCSVLSAATPSTLKRNGVRIAYRVNCRRSDLSMVCPRKLGGKRGDPSPGSSLHPALANVITAQLQTLSLIHI